MATTTRATTPQSEALQPLDAAAPLTPTSRSGASFFSPPKGGAENANLLRAHSQKTATTPDISPRSGKTGYSVRAPPIPLTGVAVMADLKRRKQQKEAQDADRQTSPNPAVTAMQSLMGGGGMSRPSDAPATDKLSEPMRKVAEKITIPDRAHGESDALQVSPVSIASFGTPESTGATSAMTATADITASSPSFVAEPMQMGEGGSYTSSNSNLAVADDDGNKAFSYPGPPPQHQQPELGSESGPSRGMSYPGIQGSPKSPASNKRHKCPYCSTDFTRHHNLKSHLLTHSQEKPYVCQTCQARFRRLHDLKRHTKLHTGERPHTCDKCGRRFARGDALARHNKGPGGCAGRRSSFGGDDDDDMDGVEYTGDGDEEDPDQQARRVSEPSRKRTHLETPQDPNRDVYRQHSSTYPPVGPGQGRPHGSSTSSMGPPQVVHPGSSTGTSPREMSGHPSPAAGSYYPPFPPPGQVFQQQGMMTESPKPLSPGQPADQHRLSVDAAMGGQHRNRSPSLTTQFQQAHFGRGSGRGTPPQPPAHFTSGTSTGPTLPPLPAGQPQGRTALQASLPGPGPSGLQHQQLPPTTAAGSNPGSLSSHGRSSGSSMRDILGQDQGGGDLWQYVRSLEQRLSRITDEYELRISRLQEDVMSLRNQVAGSQNPSYSSDMQRGY